MFMRVDKVKASAIDVVKTVPFRVADEVLEFLIMDMNFSCKCGKATAFLLNEQCKDEADESLKHPYWKVSSEAFEERMGRIKI